MRVLATGTTGFLGQYIYRELQSRGIECVGISRSGEHGLKGNLNSWNLGLNVASLESQKFDAFLHMGALYNLRAPASALQATNVSGTLSALTLARKLGIPHFLNLSSIAAVINTPNGDVGENELFLNRQFPDMYARSKALAEQLIQQWNPFFHSMVNLRLGVLVGDTQQGGIERIDGPYYIPEAFRQLKKLIYYSPFSVPVPGAGEGGAPLVPVDRAAFAVCESLQASVNFQGFETLHIVPETPVPIETLYEDSLRYLGLGHKKLKIITTGSAIGDAHLTQWLGKMPKEEIQYLLAMPRFHTHMARSILPPDWCPDYEDFRDSFWEGYEKFVQNR